MKVPPRACTQPRSLRELPKDLRNPCPVCEASPGWRCTKTVAGVAVPRKTIHPERKVSPMTEDHGGS